MKVITFDQATKVTGYSIWIDDQLVKYGTLSVEKPEKKNPWLRIREMYFAISDFLDKESPDFVCIEGIQYQNNIKTLQVLAEMRGALAAKLFEIDVGFEDIMPTEWKAYCRIKSKKRAEQKLETIQMVKRELGLDVSEDEADAIALGLFLQDILKRENRWKKGNYKNE